MSVSVKLKQIYDSLYLEFGPQNWWPGETPFEIMVGAILTQNTNWGNVEKAIANLKNANLLDPQKLLKLAPEHLAELIRPAGYYNIKTKRLRNFLKFFNDEYDCSVEQMKAISLETLREQLLSVNGIGRETADSILLYALDKPIFVCDAYTYRLLVRHDIISEDVSYDDIQALFMDNLPHDVKLFNEFHALIVRTGKEFCRPKQKCEKCPLKQ